MARRTAERGAGGRDGGYYSIDLGGRNLRREPPSRRMIRQAPSPGQGRVDGRRCEAAGNTCSAPDAIAMRHRPAPPGTKRRIRGSRFPPAVRPAADRIRAACHETVTPQH
jgi:hypothetical protein